MTSYIEHIFLGLLAFSVALECILAVLQSHAAESSIKSVPRGFEGKLTEQEHEKAARYTSASAQASLYQVFIGALFALGMTYGGGIDILTSVWATLFSDSLICEWLVFVFMLLAAACLELPFGWFMRYRIASRFGFSSRSQIEWLRATLTHTGFGVIVLLPAAAAAIVVGASLGENWWAAASVVWTAAAAWRLKFGAWVALSLNSDKYEEVPAEVSERIISFMKKHGVWIHSVLTGPRPASWRHGHVAFAGLGASRKLIVFSHAFKELDDDELMALIAHEVGHEKGRHSIVKFTIYSVLGTLYFYFAAQSGYQNEILEGFGLTNPFALSEAGARVGYVLALGVVIVPVFYYPVKPFVNAVSRWMQYRADAFAMRQVGVNSIAGALVKMHKDYSTTLTPSAAYSLFHYDRPHAGMRVERIYEAAGRLGLPLEGPTAELNPFINRSSTRTHG